MKKIMAITGASAALMFTAACGADRPTEAELSKTIESQSSDSLPIDGDAADCIAKLLVKSDISNGTLADIADEEIKVTGYTVRMPEDDIKAWEEITDDVVACVM
ncbi:MAG: hypothetical protein QM597_09880 [Aeromicrobium sp.]|uniref:hypothetical protein n=1 Tax=Aeromicrobium sp. TaxID=1871063 RepID=UPI0039E5480D